MKPIIILERIEPRVTNPSNERFADYFLSGVHADILQCLKLAGSNELSILDISNITKHPYSVVHRQLKQLIEDGIVSKKDDKVKNRYKTLIKLSSKFEVLLPSEVLKQRLSDWDEHRREVEAQYSAELDRENEIMNRIREATQDEIE